MLASDVDSDAVAVRPCTCTDPPRRPIPALEASKGEEESEICTKQEQKDDE